MLNKTILLFLYIILTASESFSVEVDKGKVYDEYYNLAIQQVSQPELKTYIEKKKARAEIVAACTAGYVSSVVNNTSDDTLERLSESKFSDLLSNVYLKGLDMCINDMAGK